MVSVSVSESPRPRVLLPLHRLAVAPAFERLPPLNRGSQYRVSLAITALNAPPRRVSARRRRIHSVVHLLCCFRLDVRLVMIVVHLRRMQPGLSAPKQTKVHSQART